MFEQSLVESTTVLRTGNRWPAIISTAFYTALAIALVSVPVLHPDVLSLTAHPILTFRPRAVPPPPPPRIHVLPSESSSSSAPAAPAAPIFHRPDLAPSTAPAEAPNFNPTSLMTGPVSTNILGLGTPSSPAVHVASGTGGTGTGNGGSDTHARLKVSQGVSAGLLLVPIQPIYPRIAIAAHQQGIVLVQAIISRSGQIESAHVVSGPAMLQASALEAVRSARYHPYLLNGQPVEVDTTFSINFRLGGAF